MTATLDNEVAELRRANAELQRQLDERAAELAARAGDLQDSLEYQTATSEVLKVISRSTFDLQPVLDTLVGTAARLCQADFGYVFRLQDGRHWLVASFGITDEYKNLLATNPFVADHSTLSGRVTVDRRVVHVEDSTSDPGLTWTEAIRLGNLRTGLGVPLLREDTQVGVIVLYRSRVEPFNDKQIALLATFADQAVIAIENVRLFDELHQRTGDLQEMLEYQTGTSDVLKIIGGSTFNIQSVFDTIVATAARLCNAETAFISNREREGNRVIATFAVSAEFDAFIRGRLLPVSRGNVAGRTALEGKVVQVTDIAADPEFSLPESVNIGKLRTVLGVPLVRSGNSVGVITLGRERVLPFSERQIDLVRTFADQAVIALENARLLTEQREALEQQTATADVLAVINSSPGDLGPVFDSMLKKALHLCGASFGILRTYDGSHFDTVATSGVPQAYAEFLVRNPQQAQPGTSGYRVLTTKSAVHVLDAMDEEVYRSGEKHRRALVDLGGGRTSLSVPLLRDFTVVGAFQIYRQRVEAFSEKQIALLQNFAAQAVIAMENARLIIETREALEQQTATAEVLQVINASPGDLAPVFDAMLEKATSLCEATFGILWERVGDEFHAAAARGVPEAYVEHARQPLRPHPKNPLGRMLRGERLIVSDDVAAEEVYRAGDPARRALVDLGGAHSAVQVALVKDDALLGSLTVFRQEVRPFSDKQIALLENFAAQAVIAMENARLITETREALEQQTATAEVLGVINSSPGDLGPVFDAMLEKALRLCDAAYGNLLRYDGEQFQVVAVAGGAAAGAAGHVFPPSPSTILSEIVDGQHLVVFVEDLPNSETYRAGRQRFREMVDREEFCSVLDVALRKEDALLGVISVFRKETGRYTDKQIALLQIFAAQAVIAIENARLITETREALEQQTATTEVLQVINSSPGDLTPVFDAILEKAHVLCGAPLGSLVVREGEHLRAVATRGYPQEYDALARQGFPLGTSTTIDRLLIPAERWVQVDDVAADIPDNESSVRRAAREIAGFRTALWVPLRKDDHLLGYISAQRQEVRPFSYKQIALLENFAAQAVIAMENARLITETREALEQQTATAEVLGVINSSPGDLAPVFDAVLEKAVNLCGAAFGVLQTNDGDRFRTAATHGVPPAYADYRRHHAFVEGPRSLGARIRAGEHIVQVLDLKDDEPYRARDANRVPLVDLGGARTGLAIALTAERVLLGFIIIYRQEVRPFSDKQIALLQNFAAQAVIAIENARLITETREALEQQTATAEVLQVINSSPGDLKPVFDALLENAMRLCGAAFGLMMVSNGDEAPTVAARGVPAAFAEFRRKHPVSMARGPVFSRLLAGEDIVHTIDLKDDEAYRRGDPLRCATVDLGGGRTSLMVALRREREVLGAIHIYRQEVRPFTDKQIALLQNFATQAVIAMENARLITETREALEQQTATSEVLQVINSSPGNLGPIFDAMLDRAMRLCEASCGFLSTYDGERFNAAATRGVPTDLSLTPVTPGPGGSFGLLVDGEDLIHVTDIRDSEGYRTGRRSRRAFAGRLGARTAVWVALRNDKSLMGAFILYRQEVRPFSDKQIALLQNFAAQAVIAIENARLLGEIRQRQAELRVTFDNMADGVAMFDEDLRLAAWNRNFQQIADLPEALLAERPSYADYLRFLTDRGELDIGRIDEELSRRLEHTDQELRLERTRPNGQVIEVRRNAVPDGGFVLIYSDITERKRSEAEIRAARDAAEATLRDLRAAQSSLIQAQKMAALGQLTAGIAHEIKNPLNFVNNFAGLSVELLDELKETAAPGIAMLDEDKRAEVDETIEMLTGNLDKIAEHGRRADNIVKSMLEHSRGVTSERRSADLNNLVEEALNLAYHGARAQDQTFNITLDRDYDRGLGQIELVPQEMSRVFINLIGNGFYAATKRQRESGAADFNPKLLVTTRDLGNVVEVRVRDNGIGIPVEIKDKLFQPFFTTKPTGEGTGLGLSISYDIVTQQHGGTIEVDSEVGEFTEFTVRLPRSYQAMAGPG